MQTAVLTFEFYNGASWVDITNDVLYSPSISFERGQSTHEPTALIANIGELRFSLNNSAENSASTQGYYSPGHASAVSGWDLGTRIRLKSTYSAADRYQFHGRVSDITLIAGKYGRRRVDVVVTDYIEELASRYIDLLQLQVSQRSNELMTTLIGTMDIAPLNTDYDAGADSFAQAFFDIQGERQTAISIAQRIVQSDMSRLYIRGNATDGETLVLESRSADYGKSSQLTLNDTMKGLEVSREKRRIYNRVVLGVNRPNIGTTAEILYDLPDEKVLRAGEAWTFTALYRDENGGGRINGKNMQEPVPEEDFSFSAVSESGNSLNDDLDVSITFGSDRAEITLTNNAAVTGYLWKFQLKGLPIRLRDPIEISSEDAASIAAYGDRKLNYTAPYLSNDNTAKSIADFLLTDWSDPTNNIQTVSFIGNLSSTLMTAAVNRDIGDKITLTETVTGISEDRIIIGLRIIISHEIWNVSYYTVNAHTGTFWLLGDSGFSELGSTTILAF